MDPSRTPGYVAGFPDTMNLRELGGLDGADGRRVRHGTLFRSGPLVALTVQQRVLVDGFGLRAMLDLRARGEARGAEDYIPDGCAYERIGGMRNEDGSEVDFSPEGIERMRAQFGQPDGMDDFMANLYVSMVFDNEATHALMELLASGATPLLFHCSAGKDRTGVCAALALMALGVSDDAIREDFLLTNEYRRTIIESVPENVSALGIGLDADSWARANGVHIEDLNGVFNAIDDRYPTREAYFEDEYGLDGRALEAMRGRLLE